MVGGGEKRRIKEETRNRKEGKREREKQWNLLII